VYTVDGQVTGWRPGNAAKRLIVGLGSGRESTDLKYQVADAAGKKFVDTKDTIRTNFYSQAQVPLERSPIRLRRNLPSASRMPTEVAAFTKI
jgi:hypothetical protein